MNTNVNFDKFTDAKRREIIAVYVAKHKNDVSAQPTKDLNQIDLETFLAGCDLATDTWHMFKYYDLHNADRFIKRQTINDLVEMPWKNIGEYEQVVGILEGYHFYLPTRPGPLMPLKTPENIGWAKKYMSGYDTIEYFPRIDACDHDMDAQNFEWIPKYLREVGIDTPLKIWERYTLWGFVQKFNPGVGLLKRLSAYYRTIKLENGKSLMWRKGSGFGGELEDIVFPTVMRTNNSVDAYRRWRHVELTTFFQMNKVPTLKALVPEFNRRGIYTVKDLLETPVEDIVSFSFWRIFGEFHQLVIMLKQMGLQMCSREQSHPKLRELYEMRNNIQNNTKTPKQKNQGR